MLNIFIILATSLIFANGVQAVTLRVPREYATIQEAVNAASDGDQILVQGKAFTETVNFKGKTLTICSIRSERETNCFSSSPGLTGDIELLINQDANTSKPSVVSVVTLREFGEHMKNPPAKPSGNTPKISPPPEYPDKMVKSQNPPEIPRQIAFAPPLLYPNQDKLPLDSQATDKSAPDTSEARETERVDRPDYAKLSGNETKSLFKENTDKAVKNGSPAARENTVMQAKKGLSVDEFEQYKQLVRLRVEANKEYPIQARRGNLQGTVTVRFLVQRDGHLKDIQVVSSSSFNILDQAAMQAVTSADPFLPLPRDISQDDIWFKLTIAFTFVGNL